MSLFSGAERPYVEGAQVRAAVLLRIATTPTPLRIWAGVGDLAIPADTIEPSGATYTGLGDLVNVPAVSQLVNGVADQLTLILSGVTPEILGLVDEEAESVRFAGARLGFAVMGADWQLASTVKWLWEGVVETPECAQSATTQDQPGARSVSLTISAGMTSRRRPVHAFYTDADQRRRSPTDRFAERTVFYSQGTTRKFGPV